MTNKKSMLASEFEQFIVDTISKLPNRRLVLIIDEYEIIYEFIEKGRIKPNFIDLIRYILHKYSSLAIILSGVRRVEEMAKESQALLLDLASTIKVGHLSRAEAVALITEPVLDAIEYHDDAIDEIIALTDGYPYFVQVLCQSLLEYLLNKKCNVATEEDDRIVLHDVLEKGTAFFSYILGLSNEEERMLLPLSAISAKDKAVL